MAISPASSQVKKLSPSPCVIGCPSVTESATTDESFLSKDYSSVLTFDQTGLSSVLSSAESAFQKFRAMVRNVPLPEVHGIFELLWV